MAKIIKITIFCLLILTVCTFISQNISSADMSYGGVTITHSDCSQIQFPALANTNSSRGTALLSAVSSAKNGDILTLTTGVFDLGDSGIDLSLGNLGSIDIHGAGKYSTIIKSSADSAYNAIIHPGNNSQVTDLSIIGTAVGSYQGPFGSKQGETTTYTNALLENVYIEAESDGIYDLNGLNDSLNVLNVTIKTNYDTIAWGGTSDSNINLYDSNLIAIASPIIYGDQARGAVSIGGVINLYNTTVSVSNATASWLNNGGNFGYFTFDPTAKINVYGGSIYTSGKDAYDLFNYLGNINVSPNTNYNLSKTHGIINILPNSNQPYPNIPVRQCSSAPFHPADIDQDNYINQSEINNYVNSFKQGLNFSGLRIPSLDNVTRANYIYLKGGVYSYNSSISCPRCWYI